MAKQITAEMATNLTLDVSSATKSLNELSRSVKQSTNEWKIQEQQMNQAGNAIGASEAKYRGLSAVVDTQKGKVEALKNALATNNTETAKGQKQQEFLTAELAKAERQLNSYQGQLDKATQSYKYQSTGLAKLNDEIKHSNDLTTARVSRLEAEGKTTEANKVKQQGLSDVVGKYNDVLKIQQSELIKIAETTGKSSNEYQKQQLRIEQTGAKIANLSADIRHLNGERIKPNVSGLDSVREKLDGLSEKLKTTQMSMSKMFMANFLANGAYGAFEHLKDKISDTLHEAVQYNKEQQVMNATWTTLTDSASKGKAMVKSINDISTAFGQSSDVTNELEQQFYHVFNQKGPTEELTKSMLTMGDTIGMNSESIQRLGLNFTHMLTSGRMQLGDFNLITDQLPMYGEKLLEFEKKAQHNTSLTMGELRKQMSAGKISADDATKVMNELGAKYKEASENMMGTASGMERVISARSKALTGALITPIMNAKNPLFGVISKWVSSSDTEKAFGNVGSAISKGFDTITKAFGKNFKGKDATKSINDAINGLADNITKFSDYIASHSKQITAFFKSIKEVGGEAFSTLKSTVQAFLPILKLVGGEAGKHPKLVGAMVVGWLSFGPVLKTTTKLVDGLTGTFKAFQKVGTGFGFIFSKNEAGISRFGKVLGGLKKTAEVTSNGLSTAFGGLKKAGSKSASGIGTTFTKMGAGIKSTAGVVKNTVATMSKSIAKSLAFTAKLAWGGFKTAIAQMVKIAKNPDKYIKYVAKMAWNGVKTALTTIGRMAKATGKAMVWTAKMAWNGVKTALTSIPKLAKTAGKAMVWTAKMAWTGVKAGLASIPKLAKGVGRSLKWTAQLGIKGFQKSLSLITKGAKTSGNGIKKSLKFTASVATSAAKKALQGLAVVARTTGTALKAAFTFAKANPIMLIVTTIGILITTLVELYKHNATFRKFVDGIWKSVVKFIKPIGKLVGDMIDGIQDTFNNIGKFLKGFWNSTKKAWNTAIKWTQDLFSGLGKFFSQWWDNFTNNWSTLFSFVKKLASGFWDTLKGLFTVGFNTLKQVFNIFKDVFTGNWSKLGADVGRLVGYLWANVKGIFNNTYNWLNHLTGGWIGRTIEGFENFGSSIGKTFSKAWNGIKSTARDAMNGVIGIVNSGIRGIDGIIHDFGGPRQAIGLIPKMPKFAKGTGGAPKGLAMVNDQKGVSDAREAIVDNSGDVHILSGKNRIVNFSGGETVIPANVTREMFPHFASGTEGWFSKVVDWTKDKFEGITNFLKDPLSSISGVIGNVINRSLGGASSFVSSVAPAIGRTFSKAIVDPIKKLLNKLNEDAGGSLGNPGGAGVQRWKPYVKRALHALNLSTSEAMVARVLRQIATESGGNPTVHQQVNDINMRLGIPAQGLMQVIPPTFRAFAVKGHNNILNGYDNILAGLNYAKHRYGSGLGALGNGHGYANGGLITQHQIAEIGEGNLPEMIIPLDKMKSSRAITLLQGAVNAVAHNNGVDVSNSSQAGMSNEQANIMIALLTKLVSQEPTIEVHNEIVGDKITTAVNSNNSRRQNINNLIMGGI